MAATYEESVLDKVFSKKPDIRLSKKKLRRMQSKKRKLSSYLKLALSEESLASRKKLKSLSKKDLRDAQPASLDDGKSLRCKLRVIKNQEDQKPDFYLTNKGIQAKLFDNILALSSIFLEDVQHLILQACLRIYSPVRARWCRLMKASKICHIVIVSVCGVTAKDFIDNKVAFQDVSAIFSDIVQIYPPSSFPTEITNFSASLNYKYINHLSSKSFPSQPLKSLLPNFNQENDLGNNHIPVKDAFPRTKILLSVVQMISEDYPLPIVSERNTSDFKWSLPRYKDVTDNSPLFAVDCEMCITDTNQRELTRISIVDEQYNVLLDTLVKPKNKIIDYVTHYSGITAEMLDGVTVTLENVQEQIRQILPPDAIICGQSLNFDLYVLKLFHPYVIDTSVIYNLSGRRHQKSSLKHLSAVFLKEDIQKGKDGHCSVEDSTATMKLVQKKLNNGILFGDHILSDDSHSSGTNTTSDTLFPMILSQQKDVCIIGSSLTLNQYPEHSLPKEVKRFVQESTEACFKCATQEAINHNVTVCHIDVPDIELPSEKFVSVNEAISKIYEACAMNALMIVVFNGSLGDKSNGLCSVKIKKT